MQALPTTLRFRAFGACGDRGQTLRLGRVFAALAAGAVLSMTAATATATAARPTEDIYARGKTYKIDTGYAAFVGADQTIVDAAASFYIIGFPTRPGVTGPITLPSGYRPQNNGQPAPIPYHDHITADLGNPLRHVIELRYTFRYAYSRHFKPLTSVAQITAAEGIGKLDVVNPGGADPYMHPTSDVLVRPVLCRRAAVRRRHPH